MPGYTPNSNIPYPLGTDPIRGTTSDYIRVDMQQLAEGADAGDVATKAAAVEQTKADLQPRLQFAEKLAAEPGTWVKNHAIDPKPLNAPENYTVGRVTLVQAPGWGRAMCNESGATSVIANTGGVSNRGVPAGPGDGVAAYWEIRAMPDRAMDATVAVYATKLIDGSLTSRTLVSATGMVTLAANGNRAFKVEVSTPEGFDHVELQLSFRRTGSTYAEVGDFVYFRKAMITVGTSPDVPPQPTYFDGDSADSYWEGTPNASQSVTAKRRGSSGSGGGGAEAHAALLDKFTQDRGGVKHIGPRTSISFRIDHGLKNFNAKMRAKLESLGFPYALALGSRDWGHSENAGITKTIVNNWVVGGFAEIWSHSISHADADTPAKIREYITESRKELEADIPAAKVDGYMPPGAGGTRYMGFGPSDTPQKFFETLAGQMILQTYAVTGGNMEVYRVQDGTPRIGQSYFNMDTFNTAGVMSRVQNAINDGRGIQLMIHPSLIDTAGHITTAQLHAVLDQIKALQDAGTVIVMSAYDQTLADSTSVPGAPGPAGPGVPTGGTAFQMIRKNSAGTTTEWVTPTKSIVGLNNVDNTSDLNKPVSAATTSALNGKADKAELTTGLSAKVDVTALSPKIAEQAVQSDYVAQLEAKSPHKAVQLVKVDSGEALQVAAHSPSGAFTTHLIEGTNAGSGRDDYRIVGDIYAGKLPGASKQYSNLVTTGTFVATSEQFAYTTQVGASIEVPITIPYAGAEVRFFPYKDNRGGVWRFTLSGQETDISTFSSAAAQEANGLLVSPPGIPKGNHVLRGEFMGDDPGNVPSGGAGTARGWLARVHGTGVNAGQYDTFKLPDLTTGWAQGTKQGIESNREFAWWLKRAGTSQTAEWVPSHTADTAFNAEPTRFFDGDRELNIFRMTVGEAIDLTGAFKMVQHVYGRNTAEPSVNLIDVWTTTTVHPSGRMTIEGRIKVNFDIEVTHPYVIMNPLNSSVFDTVISPIGNVYPNTVAQEGTNTWLPESDWGESWLFLSSANTDQAAAFRYNNPVQTTRRGGTGKTAEDNRSWLEHRTGGTILKHYQKLWATGAVIPAGTVHRFSGDYVHAQVPNAFGELSV